MPRSTVALNIFNNEVQAHFTLPADRLERAFIQAKLVPDPGPGNDTRPTLTAAAVKQYVLERTALHSQPSAPPWPMVIQALQPPDPYTDEWRVLVSYKKTHEFNTDSFTFTNRVLIQEIATHIALVTLTQDWKSGVLPESPQLLGQLGGNDHQIHWQRQNHSVWAAPFQLFQLGINHILHGLDHLVFLIALILIIPLTAKNGRWQVEPNIKRCIKNTLWWVSAFTLGHSASLLIASLDMISVNRPLIELLVASSVAIAAAHAMRPLYAGYESLVTFGFGLIHGLAFSEVMRELALPIPQLLQATASFNIGIEFSQLIIVLVLTPILMMFRRINGFTLFRLCLSALIFMASIYWIVQRLPF